MPETELLRPDFYIAAMGRSGSTMIANWLTVPPDQLVLIEPFLFSLNNPRMLRIQLENLDLAASDEEWDFPDVTWQDRFRRLFVPRLSDVRWAFKEVLGLEHARVIDSFAPSRVVVTVRDIRDIAASFFEKHRIQNNLDRFSHDWVQDYCLRETRDITQLCRRLDQRGISWRAVRYEDFTASAGTRDELCRFLEWQGGGDVGRHLDRLDRGFETDRHGTTINSRRREWSDRVLGANERRLAEEIAAQCEEYQSFFGY